MGCSCSSNKPKINIQLVQNATIKDYCPVIDPKYLYIRTENVPILFHPSVNLLYIHRMKHVPIWLKYSKQDLVEFFLE